MCEHEMWGGCWCEPYLCHVTEEGGEVWLHRTEDGSTPPPEILAEAIVAACVDD